MCFSALREWKWFERSDLAWMFPSCGWGNLTGSDSHSSAQWIHRDYIPPDGTLPMAVYAPARCRSPVLWGHRGDVVWSFMKSQASTLELYLTLKWKRVLIFEEAEKKKKKAQNGSSYWSGGCVSLSTGLIWFTGTIKSKSQQYKTWQQMTAYYSLQVKVPRQGVCILSYSYFISLDFNFYYIKLLLGFRWDGKKVFFFSQNKIPELKKTTTKKQDAFREISNLNIQLLWAAYATQLIFGGLWDVKRLIKSWNKPSFSPPFLPPEPIKAPCHSSAIMGALGHTMWKIKHNSSRRGSVTVFGCRDKDNKAFLWQLKSSSMLFRHDCGILNPDLMVY